MEKIFRVNDNTIDEWIISGSIEGNINSENLILMVHGGGYDRNENGYYTAKKDGKPYKDENNKTVLVNKPFGNYERLSTEIEANNIDACILRIDMRNHGKSLLNGNMDTRDTSWERFAKDIACVVKQMVDEYGFTKINLIGTCMGALACTYYVTKTGINDEYNSQIELINSILLISPLSPKAICTDNIEHGFNYKKANMIRTGEIKQFSKMNGVYEGIETIKEAERNIDIYKKLASLNIPTKYIVSSTDRLLPFDITQEIIENCIKINPNFEYKLIEKEISHGDADHCFYDPQSSDMLLNECMKFINKKNKEMKK